MRELLPEDRAALNQGRTLQRKQRVIREVWMRALAAQLVRRGGTRYNELMDEITKILSKEMKQAKP